MKKKLIILALAAIGIHTLTNNPEFQNIKSSIENTITVLEDNTQAVTDKLTTLYDSYSISAERSPNTSDETSLITIINGNSPAFTEQEKTNINAFEFYSELDSYGRCGQAYANICKELMPTEERGDIGRIKPSGWHTVKYPGIVEGNYLYNRCHLIAFCLAGENDNEKNLITGTRYLNVEGMLPFEEKVAEYVDKTKNHVLYRVTPIYEGSNLVASYVQMEGWSVEDNGAGICFNVYIKNIQPGIAIDYKTGNSSIANS